MTRISRRRKDFTAAIRMLAGSASDIDAAFDELDAAYRAPARAYHDWRHIDECRAWLERARRPCSLNDHDVALLAIALFYHDAIYEPGTPGNEAASAKLAWRVLERLGVDETATGTIQRLIMRTEHGATERPYENERLEVLIVDIDLAILGARWRRFMQFDVAIRDEYHEIDASTFRSGRSALLASFLTRETIYASPWFRSRLESRARANLTRLLARFYS